MKMRNWNKITSWNGTAVGLLCNVMLLVACTDRRDQGEIQIQSQPDTSNYESAARIQYNDRGEAVDTQVHQMSYKAGALYLTGSPFAFMKLDVAADPESPRVLFAARRDLDYFSPSPDSDSNPGNLGVWDLSLFARGALAINGLYAYMSGDAGTSVVSMANSVAPQEVLRYPMPNTDTMTNSMDPNFVFKGMIVHPSLPYVYGFKENDAVLTYQIQGKNLVKVGQQFYHTTSTSMCCVQGAALLGNKIYVAFTASLWIFDLPNGPTLGTPRVITKLNAVNVAASNNFIYVQHQPTRAVSDGSATPAGIYIFDANGQQAAHLNLSPQVFAVSANDSHLFANVDDRSVHIFRLKW